MNIYEQHQQNIYIYIYVDNNIKTQPLFERSKEVIEGELCVYSFIQADQQVGKKEAE